VRGGAIGFQHAERLEIVLGRDDGETKMALLIERLAATKNVDENATTFCRSALLVMVSHPRSIFPLKTDGMRSDGVIGTSLISSFARPSLTFTASATA
jgi:hypothetical protein